MNGVCFPFIQVLSFMKACPYCTDIQNIMYSLHLHYHHYEKDSQKKRQEQSSEANPSKVGPFGADDKCSERKTIYLSGCSCQGESICFVFVHFTFACQFENVSQANIEGKFVTKSYLLYHNQYHTPPYKFSRLFSYLHRIKTLKMNIFSWKMFH